MANSEKLDSREREFFTGLYNEKIAMQNERREYIIKKMAFVTALFGVGAFPNKYVDLNYLLYGIPIIALIFDLYIRAADLSIKKMGYFLRNPKLSNSSKAEQAWEKLSADNRDVLALYASVIASLLLSIASWFLLILQANADGKVVFSPNTMKITLIWAFPCIIAIIVIWVFHKVKVNRYDEGRKKSNHKS